MILESEIQSFIIKLLESKGWLVVKIIQTSKNGWPDLQAIKNGITIYIECKRQGEHPAKLQVFRHEQIEKAGAKVFIIDSKENAIEIISKHAL